MISLGISISKSFLVVGIDCKVLVNSSPSGSIIIILACHAPSPFSHRLGAMGSMSSFVGEFHIGGVRHDVYIGPLIDKGIYMIKASYAARCSVGREFFEKSKHFSHPIIDFLALLEDGVLKSFHSFEASLVFELEKSPVKCFRDAMGYSNGLDRFDEFIYFIPTFMVVEGEVLNDFPRFIGVLITEFAASGAVNLTLKIKGDMIIKKLDLKPMIYAMMRDFWSKSLKRVHASDKDSS
ncbi:hypothetical protein Tco_0260885 [Tanacetum coccineum]